jgi:hypothetical protein
MVHYNILISKFYPASACGYEANNCFIPKAMSGVFDANVGDSWRIEDLRSVSAPTPDSVVTP